MTLELERDALSSNAESTPSPSSARNAHEPLVLVSTASPVEHLVVIEGAASALAVAVVREEETGTFCYPHGPAHPRLGPFGSADEALDACREVQRSERCYDSCCQGL